jgi:hypothetical protein
VCCPVGSLNRPPHASVNWDGVQQLAKCTGGLAEAVADTDGSGVADWLAGLGRIETDAWPLGRGVGRIVAGDGLQPAVTRATLRAPFNARGRHSICNTTTAKRMVVTLPD